MITKKGKEFRDRVKGDRAYHRRKIRPADVPGNEELSDARRQSMYHDLRQYIEEGNKSGNYHGDSDTYAQAKELMDLAKEKGGVRAAAVSAQAIMKLGKKNLSPLVKDVNATIGRYEQKGHALAQQEINMINNAFRDTGYKISQEFGNTKLEKVEEGKTLVTKLAGFIAIVLGGIGVGIMAGGFTGNVVGNQGSGQNIFGSVLIILGIIGAYFYFNK